MCSIHMLFQLYLIYDKIHINILRKSTVKLQALAYMILFVLIQDQCKHRS